MKIIFGFQLYVLNYFLCSYVLPCENLLVLGMRRRFIIGEKKMGLDCGLNNESHAE